jgi:hypothetical protein
VSFCVGTRRNDVLADVASGVQGSAGKNMPTRTLYAAAVLFLIVATQPGCNATETSPLAQDTSQLHIAAARSATTIDSASAITYISAYFASAGTAAMRDLATTEASALVVAQVQSRAKADLLDVACVSVETDDKTFVNLTFDHCVGAHGMLNLDGTVGAQVGFEVKPCGPASCPVAVVYSVNTTDLHIGAASIIGDWQVRDPLAAELPYTWAGLLDVVTPERGAVFTSSATFTRTDDCVDLSIDSTVGGSGQRSFTSSASGVHRCMNACPATGTVTIVTQDSETLTWSYDGGVSATVSSDVADDFLLGLTCDS